MALPDYFKAAAGTAKTVKSSGGDAAITCTSLAASGSARESTKLDLGASWARRWRITFEFKLTAAGTNGTEVELYANQSPSGTAGTDNNGNASGTDAAFSNPSEHKANWTPVMGVSISNTLGTGVHRKTVSFFPLCRYQSYLVINGSNQNFSGAAGDTIITVEPVEESIAESV